MNHYPTRPNPGVERDNLPSRRTKGSTYDWFQFPPNNQFGIPASDQVYGWQTKSLDCISTRFDVDHVGKIELHYPRGCTAKDFEHTTTRALTKGTFCTDQLVLIGCDAYHNPREFVIQVRDNYIHMVMEADAIIYTAPEPKPEMKWLGKLMKLFASGE